MAPLSIIFLLSYGILEAHALDADRLGLQDGCFKVIQILGIPLANANDGNYENTL